ncbi:MAG: GNAT family N-acetyltransferase [Geodermatophilaceae bacterium]|nr:GNAT family N-acetyltransferase [Geodermatophilaceae bacterium]
MSNHLTWRALSRADIPALVRLLDQSERVDETSEHYDVADLADEFDDETLDLAIDSVAVFDGPDLVGMGVVRARGVVRNVHVVELWGTVQPSHRGEGVGRGIFARQLHRAAALHAERHPDVIGRVVVRPYDHCPDHVQLVKAAGLTPLRHWFDMERDLSDPLPDVPAPGPGLDVVGYDAGRDEELRLAYNAAFAGNFGAVEQDRDGWAQWFTGSRAFRADLSRLVLHGERVVGFLLSYFYEADTTADGRREAWIGQVGTIPDFRRQGIGTTLIGQALHAYRKAGFSRAVLDVDGESDIGGLGIYSRLGFRVARKRTSFVRTLPTR